MENKLKKKYLLISFVALLLGLMISSQYKLIDKNYLGGMIPTRKLSKMKSELEDLHAEKDLLTEKVNELQEKLDKLILEEVDDDLAISTLNQDLNNFKMLAGFTNLQGEGVAVYLDNSPSENEVKESDIAQDYNLILFLVNELNAAGSEAISINDQRYISRSEIRGIDDHILVNGVSLKPPYIIKAIGNKDVLATALEQRFGIIDIIRKRGYFCEINKLNDLRIMGSNKVFDWKYAKPVEEKGL